MTNKVPLQDEELIRRLGKLKDAGAGYPADLLEKRRAFFRNAVMGLTLPIPAAGIIKGLVHFLTHITWGTMKGILIGAIVVELGLSAYLFRDEIKDWLTSETATPAVTFPSRTPRPTLTSTATPTPTLTASTTMTTPKPHPTDPGHHYGQTQTPKP